MKEKILTCFGCMIALLNAIDSTNEVEREHILSCLKDVKEDKDVDDWISILREDKRKVVPDCFVCTHPCGRVDEIRLNKASQKRAIQLLDTMDSMNSEEILFTLGGLPYEIGS